MARRFLAGVADADIYIGDRLVATGKTLLDSSINISSSSEEVRGGDGARLFGKYYHTSTFGITLTDVMFKLDYIAFQTGSEIISGADIFNLEQITLADNGVGKVSGSPVSVDNYGVIGWATIAGKEDYQTVTFNDKDFTFAGGKAGDIVCVKYMVSDPASKKIVVSSSFVPKTVKIVLTANEYEGEFNADSGDARKAGVLTINVPRFQFSGSQEISLTATGATNMPISGSVLDNPSIGCSTGGYYAIITETIFDSKWYDNLIALAVSDGDVEIAVSEAHKLTVYAMPKNGPGFPVAADLLTFTSGSNEVATVDDAGIVTGVAQGDTNINIAVKDNPEIETVVAVSVTTA